MDTALDRSDRNAQHIGGFAVLEPLEVNELNHALQRVTQAGNGFANPVPFLASACYLQRILDVTDELIGPGAGTIAPFTARRSIEADHPISLQSPLHIDRLVGRDRIQPRSESAGTVELVTLQMHLQERALKGIFC